MGTQAHTLARAYLQGHQGWVRRLIGQYAPEHPLRMSFMAWYVWSVQHELAPLFTERLVVSRKERYAGRLDYYGWVTWEIDKKMVRRLDVLDWKTSNALRKNMELQPPAYRQPLVDEGRRVDGCAIVRFGTKQPGVHNKTVVRDLADRQDLLYERFLDAKRLFDWLRRYPKAPKKPLETLSTKTAQKGRHSGLKGALAMKGWQ